MDCKVLTPIGHQDNDVQESLRKALAPGRRPGGDPRREGEGFREQARGKVVDCRNHKVEAFAMVASTGEDPLAKAKAPGRHQHKSMRG